MPEPSPKTTQVLSLAREMGTLRPRDLAAQGIPTSYLAYLSHRGLLLRTGRGLYTLPDGDWTEHHSLVEIAKRIPACVIGLLSALRYHDLTTQMPHQVWILMDRKARHPRVDYPPVRVFRCDAGRLQEDVIRTRIEGVEVALTNIPRTVADCFKHRRAVGLDVAIEALRDALRGRLCTPSELTEAARRARIWNLMRPYLEALL